jgi:hypothetical protein
MSEGTNYKWGRASSKVMAVACCLLAITISSLLSVPKATAIEMIPGCQENFEKFKNWNQYYKVFVYGIGGGRAGCTSAIGEEDALSKCKKMLRAWGSDCRVYAKSPVNGKLAIVWVDRHDKNASGSKKAVTADYKKAEWKRNKQDDKKVCSAAIKIRPNQTAYWNSTNPELVKQAVKRGFSPDDCVTIANGMSNLASSVSRKTTSSPVGGTQAYWSAANDHTICAGAMPPRDKGVIEWAFSRYPRHREEAERRGFTPKACAEILGWSITFGTAEEKTARKTDEERESDRAGDDRKVEQHRAKIAQAEKQQRLAQDQRRKMAKARKKHLAPLRKKNRHSFAVIIGNKNYKGRTPKVSYAHNDADAMKRFVLDRLAYREGNVIDLRDATRNEIATMFGNKDTHKGRLFNIIRAGKSDVTVFYSGHGVPGLDNRRPYLLPVDGDPNLAEITGYPVDVLYSNLAKLPARSITVYLDACFSGESEKGMLISATSGISVTPKMPKTKSWMTVITAAQGDQFASWDEKAKHGLFTKHLLEALNGKADTEDFGNSDGKVSLAEVQNYLDDEMTYQARFVWNRQQRASVRGQDKTVLASVFKMPKGLSDVASIEEMDATYVVLKSANLRAGPSTDTSIVGKLAANYSVNVTGKVIGKNWYRLNDGSFVFGSIIRVSEKK